jgi:cobalt-zinc-cadmium efflux system membrane fusion protein
MRIGTQVFRLWVTAAAGFLSAAGFAAGNEFAVSDEQLARLGVTLGTAQPVELVELAAVPAEVVVPPARQALVSAPAGGVVARMLVAEGDAVTAGQPVAELDSVEYVERQREYLDAVAAADLTEAQEARDRGLFAEGIIAERRVNESAAAARGARSRLDQVRAQLTLAGLTGADFGRLAAQRQFTPRITLRAPFAGVVAAEHAKVGARIDTLDPVLAIADLSNLWLELRLPQENAARVAPGMLVSVATAGQTITGNVTTVGGTVDAATQTVLVRAAVENTQRVLRAGQFLTARVLARPAGGVAYAVPVAAVTRNGGDVLLFVRSGGGVIAQRIDVLADDGKRVYVAGGIGADAVVALDGISALKALWLAAGKAGG